MLRPVCKGTMSAHFSYKAPSLPLHASQIDPLTERKKEYNRVMSNTGPASLWARLGTITSRLPNMSSSLNSLKGVI